MYLLGQHCLHVTFKLMKGKALRKHSLHVKTAASVLLKYEKLPNIAIHACKNITEKNDFVENVWLANSVLFIYVLTHCVRTVK